MASRTKQKEEARARRLAEEQARQERAQRGRRMRMLAGVVLAAAVVIAVAVVLSTSGSGTNTKASSAANVHSSASACKAAGATATCSTVESLLAGIPQSGQTLGSSGAKVTVTEYGDLECPVCRDFALGTENQLISKDVRSGKVKLVYKSLETATGGAPNPNIFVPQQAAAYAAGLQGKAWNYIELFYHEQGQEQTGYVTNSYLQGLAHQVSGLNYSQWLSDSKRSSLASQVQAEEQQAAAANFNSTPTLVVQGPKGEATPIVGAIDYGTLASKIASVS